MPNSSSIYYQVMRVRQALLPCPPFGRASSPSFFILNYNLLLTLLPADLVRIPPSTC